MSKDPFESVQPVIAIDGPAKSGKSTVARKLANKLRFIHLNSGALFRAIALEARRLGIDWREESQVNSVKLNFEFALEENGETSFRINGVPAGPDLDSTIAGEGASTIALYPAVRQKLLDVQREASSKHPLVVEGRDAGTIVFPNTKWKFYLDAPEQVRVQRRFDQLTAQGELPAARDGKTPFELVEAELQRRDFRDVNRDIAPVKAAEDAERIDCTNLSVDEVVKRIAEKVGSVKPN